MSVLSEQDLAVLDEVRKNHTFGYKNYNDWKDDELPNFVWFIYLEEAVVLSRQAEKLRCLKEIKAMILEAERQDGNVTKAVPNIPQLTYTTDIKPLVIEVLREVEKRLGDKGKAATR